MTFFFFDIDGTLLLSGGAGRVAMQQVMSEMYQLTELHTIKVHGRTDRGIITDLFAAHEIPLDEDTRDKFTSRYHELLPKAMEQCDGRLMPSVVELLEELQATPQVCLGILTGNSESAAITKLKHLDLDQYFDFGGYGEKHSNRNDVAQAALVACRNAYDDLEIAANQTWVVGDTVNDITCARSIGSNVVAVGTGGAEIDELRAHNPDLLLADLSDIKGFINATVRNP